MKDTIRYQVPLKRAIYQELKIEGFKEGKQINALVKKQIADFENSLIEFLAEIKETRKKQEEQANPSENNSSESNLVIPEDRIF